VAAVIALGLDDPRWLRFVEGSPAATPFHHPSWASMLARCYGYPAFALVHPDPQGRILAGLPVIEVRSPLARRRWVSLPFTDECQALLHPGIAQADLVAELDEARRRAGVSTLQVRAALDGPGAAAGPVAVTHHLPLEPDPDVVYRRLRRPSVRRWITRAEKDGVVVRHGDTPASLDVTFYRLHLQTRHRQGVPVQPRRYFQLLWEQLIGPGKGFLLLASSGRTVIAGAVFLAWGDTVIYKYGASDTAYWGLHPNHLLMWSAIRWGCEHGYRIFDFGRSDLASSGLRQFKDSWGAQERSLVYTVVGGKAPEPSRSRLHGLLGAALRRSPPVACQVAGELLYRYAA
jgi:CelD/BcsL family acetyltransferase involved in cellulose biosynthesis